MKDRECIKCEKFADCIEGKPEDGKRCINFEPNQYYCNDSPSIDFGNVSANYRRFWENKK